MLRELTDQDLDFQEIRRVDDNNAELVAACWYENGRESCNNRTAFEWWRRLEKPRAELIQSAKDQGIDEKDLKRAFLYYWQALCGEQHAVKHAFAGLRRAELDRLDWKEPVIASGKEV